MDITTHPLTLAKSSGSAHDDTLEITSNMLKGIKQYQNIHVQGAEHTFSLIHCR